MGEALDFHVGERVDMLAVVEIAKDPRGLDGSPNPRE